MAHVSQIPVMYEKTNQKGTTRIVRSMSGGVSLLPPSHFTKQTTTKGEAKEGNEDENCEKITFSLGSKLNVSLKNSQFHSESKVSKSFSESKGMTKEVNNKLQIAKETAKETVNESYKSVTPTHKVMSKPSENIKSENESVLYEPASGNNVSKDKLKATITTIQQMPIDNPSTPENDPRFSQLPPNLSNQLSKIQSRLAGQNIDPLSSRESLRSIYGLNLQGLSVNNTARPSMHFACPPSLIEPPELNLPKYKMTKKPRGLCVVISNKDFSKGRASCPGLKDGLKDRRGTDVDADNLKSIFEWFEFKVEVHKDKEGHAMWTTLLNYTKVDHSDYDCFVCCILTHGCFNGLHGVDGKVLKVQQALMLFNGTACPSLANKPKLFFLQACRGTSTDLGYKKDSSSTEESDEIFSDVVNLSSDPSESDYFVGYATPPGM